MNKKELTLLVLLLATLTYISLGLIIKNEIESEASKLFDVFSIGIRVKECDEVLYPFYCDIDDTYYYSVLSNFNTFCN